MYRHIFNTQYSIEFYIPKKDWCDACEGMKINEHPTEIGIQNREEHQRSKKETEAEIDTDRTRKYNFVICFDLQKVVVLPQVEVSNFFYKKKLNVYHMTTHSSVDKRGYGALWNESQNGRSGNDIASSVYRILETVVAEHAANPRI